MKATEVAAGLAESNGSLLPGGWLKVTCGLTARTPASALGPTLGNEYGKTLPYLTNGGLALDGRMIVTPIQKHNPRRTSSDCSASFPD